jgi:hypothetical protein
MMNKFKLIVILCLCVGCKSGYFYALHENNISESQPVYTFEYQKNSNINSVLRESVRINSRKGHGAREVTLTHDGTKLDSRRHK